jgi:prolipoprotein diacylglyceryltransferase
MLFNFIWNVDPKIFSSGPFQFTWLTICLVSGALVGKTFLLWLFKKEGRSRAEALTIFNLSLVGAILGGRLFYVILFETDLMVTKPIQVLFPFDFGHGFTFTGISQFSMLGGLIGLIIAIVIYSRLKKTKIYNSLDMSLLWFVVILIFLRIGNFFQADYYGKPTDGPYGALFVSQVDRYLVKLPCCVMRVPDGENPLDKVEIREGKISTHQSVGYQPLLIYLFFTEGATEQLVNEFLIGDVKIALNEMSDLIFEPGTEPLHYTVYEEDKGKYIARIQTIGIARHPVQLYEGLGFLILLLAVLWYRRKYGASLPSRKISGVLVMSIGGFSFFFQFLMDLTTPIIEYLPLTKTQYLAALVFLIGLFLMFLPFRNHTTKTVGT